MPEGFSSLLTLVLLASRCHWPAFRATHKLVYLSYSDSIFRTAIRLSLGPCCQDFAMLRSSLEDVWLAWRVG